MTAPQLSDEAKAAIEALSIPACPMCYRFEACKVADVAPKFVASIFPKDEQGRQIQEPFFKPETLARICRQYVRASAVVTQ